MGKTCLIKQVHLPCWNRLWYSFVFVFGKLCTVVTLNIDNTSLASLGTSLIDYSDRILSLCLNIHAHTVMKREWMSVLWICIQSVCYYGAVVEILQTKSSVKNFL